MVCYNLPSKFFKDIRSPILPVIIPFFMSLFKARLYPFPFQILHFFLLPQKLTSFFIHSQQTCISLSTSKLLSIFNQQCSLEYVSINYLRKTEASEFIEILLISCILNQGQLLKYATLYYIGLFFSVPSNALEQTNRGNVTAPTTTKNHILVRKILLQQLPFFLCFSVVLHLRH